MTGNKDRGVNHWIKMTQGKASAGGQGGLWEQQRDEYLSRYNAADSDSDQDDKRSQV